MSSKKIDALDYVPTAEYSAAICAASYIGRKGYTIPKSALDPDDLAFLYKDLYMIPVKNGPAFCAGGGADTDAFPVYRENANKIYLPRFYGIERYGRPSRDEICTLGRVQPIRNAPFVKQLRDYQEVVVGRFLEATECGKALDTRGGILNLSCAAGKCLSLNTPILMYDGTIKMVQDVVVGDQIMGDDSTPRNILSLARGRETMYKVHEKRGNGYTVNASHILSLKKGLNYKDPVVDISVKDYISGNFDSTLYGYRVPITFPEQSTPIPSYNHGNILAELSKSTHLMEIDNTYKINSREKRLELLAGIVDKIGKKKYNSYEIQCISNFKKDIEFVARSLGFYIEDIPEGISISGKGIHEIPVRVLGKISVKSKNLLNYEIHLEKLPVDDYYGFTIDGNHRFVLGDFTVTHNTVMAINIIAQIKQKTLVIVHKEFLLNQWIERIAEFCPKATIGRIQGTKFDVEDKDVVIGMLQTIYDRDFPEGTFDQFGLTIVDEVHRIGSCQFSRALLRVQTPIMLGVTATLDRKDGLTRVIHHFMGPIIYQQSATVDRTEFEHVLVRGMEFQHRDPEFCAVATDFRGNVQYSTMISKISGFGPRTAFLVRILRDLIDENPEAQILVLGHTRGLLTELHDIIVDQEIATVGYYLGGMKQRDLDRSTERQILLATYAMASEGFDHKNLSILVMITPKTDIVQSVGRIFRTRHDRPIIVDVIDQHDVFKNQWRKRLPYYRKMGYQIQTIESGAYHGFQDPRTVWTAVRPGRGGGEAAATKRGGGGGGCSLAKGGITDEDLSGKCLIKF